MDEEEYLDFLSRRDPSIRIYDANDPNSLLDMPSVVPINQSAAQAIDRMRHFIGYDQYTGEELYEYTTDAGLEVPIGRTWKYDFNKEEFELGGSNTPLGFKNQDHVLITQWITRCLNTERYMYDAYPDWFGVELGPVWRGELVGVSAMYHVSEEIKDALMTHDRITAVEVVDLAEDSGTISLRCNVFLDDHEKVLELSLSGLNGEFTIG